MYKRQDADINALIDSAPGTLNTLDEIAAALGDDPSFTTTVNNAIALKAPIANPVFTGNATFDSPTLYVDGSNNRVGVGTTSPSTALEVNNASAGATVATFEGTYSGSGDVKLASFERNGGAVAAAVTYTDATTDMEFGTTTSHGLSLTTADTRRLTMLIREEGAPKGVITSSYTNLSLIHI